MADERPQNHAGEAGDPARATASAAMVCPSCGGEFDSGIRFCPADGSLLRAAASSADDLIGRVIDDRYYLAERVGQGGMGEVFRAEHVRTRGRCAVKIINRILANDADAVTRFMREATNAGRISHHNVATVHDFGETGDGLLYLAMEYVDGEPLAKIIETEGALPAPRAVGIARQVAEAVGTAHELGIVHRDLKPSNIMIVRERKGGDLVKVVDFGIARTTGDENQRLTRTGLVVGTPEYMSPEQLIGDPVDGRSDIYSLGCILYQMLTGEHAFGGPTANVITRRLTEPPPRPRARNPSISKILDDVIVQALGRTPAERFQTMDELRDALAAAPTAPVESGSRRIASWLGFKVAKPDVPAAADPGRATPARPITSPTGVNSAPSTPTPSPLTPAPDAPFTPSAGSPVGVGAPRTDEQPGPGGRTDPSFERAPTGERTAGNLEVVPVADDATAPPLKRGPSKGAVAAALVAVGGVAAVALVAMGGGGAEVAVDDPGVDTTTAIAAPLPPPISPDSALAEVRAMLANAVAEADSLRYPEALALVASAEAGLDTLITRYPQRAEFQVLADSANYQMTLHKGQCYTYGRVQLELGLPAPPCEAN